MASVQASWLKLSDIIPWLRHCIASRRAVATEYCLADAATPERKAQHAAARLRTKQYFDIATLAWDAKLESLVREACPLALAMDWSPEIDPEVVRWQAEVGHHKRHVKCSISPCCTLCCQERAFAAVHE